MSNAKGFTTLSVNGEDYRIRLGFSEIADADEYLGKSIIAAMISDPMNFHLMRVLFYFGTREESSINTVKKAGRVIEDGDTEEISKLMLDALKASGVMDDDDSGEA